MERSKWMSDAGYTSGVNAERRSAPVLISTEEGCNKGRGWSFQGRAVLVLVPVLLWLLGVAITQDVKQQMAPAVTVDIFALGLGAFALRMGAIVLWFLCAYSAFFRRPSPHMPRWMTTRDA